ncbi:MAG: hypothetical protein K1Y36_29405 [Blastocatellia bacterium]|nr:hypothetical protein [Blastocatellia bacterium]
MAYPRSLPPTFRPATERQLEALADYHTGLPLGVIEDGFSSATASRFLTLWENDAYHGKRPCKKCHSFVLVVSPFHEAAPQFWGEAQTGCLCVPCFRKTVVQAPPAPAPRPRPVASQTPATVTVPATSASVPAERIQAAEFQPVPVQPLGYYPEFNFPEEPTFWFLWYMVKRFDGWLDRETICDLLLGDTVKIFRGDERLRVHPQELEDLPAFGSDMARYKAAKDRANLERLCDHVLEILCHSREIANHNGVFRAIAWRTSSQFPHLSEVFEKVPAPSPQPAPAGEAEADLRRLYAGAVARAMTELPVHARSREAVRQKTHHLLDRLGRMWSEEHFATAWNEAADSRRIA